MTDFQIVILSIMGVAIITTFVSVYLMVMNNSREEEFEDTKRQMNCLRNEIDHLTEEVISHNNQAHTVHGQFQTIVDSIDQILTGKIVYGKPNYWETH